MTKKDLKRDPVMASAVLALLKDSPAVQQQMSKRVEQEVNKEKALGVSSPGHIPSITSATTTTPGKGGMSVSSVGPTSTSATTAAMGRKSGFGGAMGGAGGRGSGGGPIAARPIAGMDLPSSTPATADFGSGGMAPPPVPGRKRASLSSTTSGGGGATCGHGQSISTQLQLLQQQQVPYGGVSDAPGGRPTVVSGVTQASSTINSAGMQTAAGSCFISPPTTIASAASSSSSLADGRPGIGGRGMGGRTDTDLTRITTTSDGTRYYNNNGIGGDGDGYEGSGEFTGVSRNGTDIGSVGSGGGRGPGSLSVSSIGNRTAVMMHQQAHAQRSQGGPTDGHHKPTGTVIYRGGGPGDDTMVSSSTAEHTTGSDGGPSGSRYTSATTGAGHDNGSAGRHGYDISGLTGLDIQSVSSRGLDSTITPAGAVGTSVTGVPTVGRSGYGNGRSLIGPGITTTTASGDGGVSNGGGGGLGTVLIHPDHYDGDDHTGIAAPVSDVSGASDSEVTPVASRAAAIDVDDHDQHQQQSRQHASFFAAQPVTPVQQQHYQQARAAAAAPAVPTSTGAVGLGSPPPPPPTKRGGGSTGTGGTLRRGQPAVPGSQQEQQQPPAIQHAQEEQLAETASAIAVTASAPVPPPLPGRRMPSPAVPGRTAAVLPAAAPGGGNPLLAGIKGFDRSQLADTSSSSASPAVASAAAAPRRNSILDSIKGFDKSRLSSASADKPRGRTGSGGAGDDEAAGAGGSPPGGGAAQSDDIFARLRQVVEARRSAVGDTDAAARSEESDDSEWST